MDRRKIARRDRRRSVLPAHFCIVQVWSAIMGIFDSVGRTHPLFQFKFLAIELQPDSESDSYIVSLSILQPNAESGGLLKTDY